MRWLPFIGKANSVDLDRSQPPASDAIDDLGNPTIPCQSGRSLIEERNRAVTINKIRQLVGLPDDVFDRLYRDVIDDFAQYVQLLPATRDHHHTRLGGLLDHSLDVAARALSLRRGRLLPPNQPPEVIARRADRWTYGVFLAALFHDLGRLLTGPEVIRFDADGRNRGTWSPIAGHMAEDDRYHFTFRNDPEPEDGSCVAAFLARPLLSASALGWIAQDDDLATRLIASLQRDQVKAGILGSIVADADQQSINADTGISSPSSSSQVKAPARSLKEEVTRALCGLVDASLPYLNQPESDILVTETDLWLSSEGGLRSLRERLVGGSIVSIQGADGAIMDTLQKEKICTPTPKGRSVWSVQIFFQDIEQRLTMLRFPVDIIWPKPEDRPAAFSGDIVAAGSTVATKRPSRTSEKPNWKQMADHFLAWLADNIEQGRMPINERQGAIWTVQEGLLLRSPGAWQSYQAVSGHNYRDVQKAVRSQGVLMMNEKPKPTPMLHYLEKTEGLDDLELRGYVIKNPKDVLQISLPAVCQRITRDRSPEGHF